jgi:hypothetical protein
MRGVRISPVALCTLAAALSTAGCLGYRVGTSLPLEIRTVHVPTFANHSGEPLVEIETTRVALNEFQKDGNLSIAGATDADVLLKVSIQSFSTEPISYERDSAKSPSEYRLRIKAQLVLTSQRNGRELLKRTVVGEATFLPGSDLTTAKRSATPEAAQDLAHNIVESVVEFW